MMPTETTDKITGVSETLMITLYARYVESQRQDAIFRDSKAVEIVNKIDYDFAKYAQGWASQLGCVIRAQTYDRLVSDFLQKYPEAIVINLGAGLCTRFFRVDNGKVRWYEVDFPEVIALKRRLMNQSDRFQLIPGSILDQDWIEKIERRPEQPILIILEGVSMYLTEVELKTLFQLLRLHLAPAHIFLDVINTHRARNTQQHDTVSRTNAEFKWGIDDSQDLEKWGCGITLKDEIYYLTRFADYPHRLPWWGRYLRPILVRLYQNFGRLVQIEVST